MARHYEGFKMINLIDENESKRLEREIFYANNPECKTWEDEIDSDLNTLDKPMPHDKSKQERNTKPKRNYLQKLWASGGPVKLLPLSGDSAFHIIFKNYEHLKYDDLKVMLSKYGSLLSIRELQNNYLRARFENEEDVRNCYRDLILNNNYDVDVIVDTKDYWSRKNDKNNKRRGRPFYGNDYFTREPTKEEEEILTKALADEAKIGFKVHKPTFDSNNQSSSNKPKPLLKTQRTLVGTWRGHRVISHVEY